MRKMLDEVLEIELREVLSRKEKQFSAAELSEREKSSWLRDRKEYKFAPAGQFVLSILTYCGEAIRKVWSDGKKQCLENCLGSFIAGLRVAAEGINPSGRKESVGNVSVKSKNIANCSACTKEITRATR